MNNLVFDAIISTQAEWIREKIIEGKIYGMNVDMNNLQQVMVAAYYLGRAEELKSNLDDHARFRDFIDDISRQRG